MVNLNYFIKEPNNKITLRSLSMIIRSKKFSSNEERLETSKKSLEFAKSAINADIKDSESWCII